MMIPKKRVSSGNWLHLRLELGFYLQPDFSMPNVHHHPPAGVHALTNSPCSGRVNDDVRHFHSTNRIFELFLLCPLGIQP